jgi:endonuclease/exonuclease/phosphatase (EEP) superfamily protein YafD
MPGRWASAVASVVVVGLLLGSLLLAAVRVADPEARRLIELVSLTPVGLPLAGAALLGALVLRVLGAARVALVAVVAAVCLVAVHAWWLAPSYAGSRPAGGRASLVVLAQNFEYGDPEALADVVRTEQVDVLVLTDVGTERLTLALEAGIETLLPYSAGVEDHVVHGGAVVLSRLPVSGTEPLYEGSESRLVDLEAPGLGTVTIAAVHTRPPYDPDAWRHDHEQVRTALAEVCADADRAVVVAGDLNATLAHAPVRRLVDLGLTDSAVQANAGWSPTWPSGGHQRRLGLTVPAFAAIDHVLTSPALVATSSRTVGLRGADHRAVLATISVAR